MVPDTQKSLFAARLNSALDAAGIAPKGKGRQNIVADMFSVSQKGARKWLEGEGMPGTARIPEMAARLNVGAEWLLSGRGDRHIAKEPAHYRGGEELENEPASDALDTDIIRDILEIIEQRREQIGADPQPLSVIAEVIATTYPEFALEKKRSRRRQSVIDTALKRAAQKGKAIGQSGKNEKARD